MKKDVFISYSSRESSIAYAVRDVLEENGISCWMAPESIAPGANYMQEIPEGIKNSKLFLLLLSQAAQESTWVLNELSQAASFGKMIIPFMIKKCEVNPAFSFALSSSQRLDAYEKLSEKLEELVIRIKGILNVERKISGDEVQEEKDEKISAKIIQEARNEDFAWGKKTDADVEKNTSVNSPSNETQTVTKLPFFGGKRNVYALLVSALVSIPLAIIIAFFVTSGEDDKYWVWAAGDVNRIALYLGFTATLTVLFGKLRRTGLLRWCYWLNTFAMGVMYTEFCRNMENFEVGSFLLISIVWFVVAVLLFSYFYDEERKLSCARYLGSLFFGIGSYPVGFIVYALFAMLLKFSEEVWLTITSVGVFIWVLLFSAANLDDEMNIDG